MPSALLVGMRTTVLSDDQNDSQPHQSRREQPFQPRDLPCGPQDVVDPAVLGGEQGGRFEGLLQVVAELIEVGLDFGTLLVGEGGAGTAHGEIEGVTVPAAGDWAAAPVCHRTFHAAAHF